MPLTEAQTLVMKQKNELTEAHNTISTLETELMKAKMLSMKQEVTFKRNVELIDRIEGANRERQTNNQTTTDATQPIPDGGSGSSDWSSDSSVKR